MEENQEIEETPRSEIIAKKKKRFKRYMFLAGSAVLIILAIFVITRITMFIFSKTRDSTVVEKIPVEVVDTPTTNLNKKVFTSDKRGVSLEYNSEDFIVDKTNYTQINYKNTIPLENVGETTIKDGYFLRVTSLYIETKSLEEIVKIKRDSFVATCPSTADISNIENTQAGGASGKRFNVKNCGMNYIVTYAIGEDAIFEVTGVYKGDIGYEQKYRSEVEDITDSIKFIYTAEEPSSPFVTYKDSRLGGFSFEYPRDLDTKCCQVAFPPGDNPQSIVVAENDNNDALGVFVDKNIGGLEFKDFIKDREKILVDEFTIVNGVEPNGKETELKDGVVLLSGYSWRGNDLVYIEHPYTTTVIVISKTNINNYIFNEILNSFKFQSQ